jgi:N-acetylglucosamine kinase-like BadF-type ATPase
MPILIGADVGGSKTAVGISEPGGPVLSRADGPGAAVRPGRALASAGVIAEVVRRALAGIGRLGGDVLVVGAAGAGRDPERTELQKALRAETLADTVVVTTDIEIALEGAFDGPGIVVSAGTGSIAVGRDRQGKRRRIGGYGWQMGDEGSGYGIGRAALGAVSRAYDGRSPRTALTDRVLTITRSTDFDALVRWAAGASPAEIAGLAPAVLQVAAQGDPLAQGIADYAARELCQLAICLLPLLDVAPPVGVALTGGLLTNDVPLRRSVVARLREENGLQPIETPVDAVVGALRLAAAARG